MTGVGRLGRCERVSSNTSRGRVWGDDVNEDHHNDQDVKVLHRMIIYIRDEALRLNVADVAFLLNQAEDAVVAFAPLVLAEQVERSFGREASTLDH